MVRDSIHLFECDGCGGYHPIGYAGDCRADVYRVWPTWRDEIVAEHARGRTDRAERINLGRAERRHARERGLGARRAQG